MCKGGFSFIYMKCFLAPMSLSLLPKTSSTHCETFGVQLPPGPSAATSTSSEYESGMTATLAGECDDVEH